MRACLGTRLAVFKVLRIALLLQLLLCPFSMANAQFGVAFSSGEGVHHITPLRFSFSWDFGPIWREEASWGLNAIWETSFSVWDGPRREDLAPERVTDLQVFTTGPMFRWQRQTPFLQSGIIPYVELGVSASWLSKTEIEGRVLSLHFQFEDKFGVGMRFGRKQQYDIGVRAYHYSNCSIKRPNSGVNFVMASIGFWFPDA